MATLGAGPWSETQDATESVQQLCDEVKCQVEEKTGKTYGMFRAIEFRSQGVYRIVHGTNLLIKVHVGCDDYLHIRIFQSFLQMPNYSEVRWVEEGHHKCDPLIPEEGHHEYVGPWSETQDATQSVQQLCDEMKPQVEEKTGKTYGMFRAIEFRGQGVCGIVPGTNLLIKVHVECHDYLHIQIFHSFLHTGNPSVLRSIEGAHQKCDPLIPIGSDSTA